MRSSATSATQIVFASARVARALLDQLSQFAELDVDLSSRPIDPGARRHAVLSRRPDGEVASIREPLTPLLDTTLLTSTAASSRTSGISCGQKSSLPTRSIWSWRSLAGQHRTTARYVAPTLRPGTTPPVLTTTYTGSTERRALEVLAELDAEVHVSYDLSTACLRQSLESSIAARASPRLTSDRRILLLRFRAGDGDGGGTFAWSAARNPAVIAKFESRIRQLLGKWRLPAVRSGAVRRGSEVGGSLPRPSPVGDPRADRARRMPFQERLLELVALSPPRVVPEPSGGGSRHRQNRDGSDRLRPPRPRGCRDHASCSVAHRGGDPRSILGHPFRYALRDANFGEKWVGGRRRHHASSHVFASVQSLNATDLTHRRTGSLRRHDVKAVKVPIYGSRGRATVTGA